MAAATRAERRRGIDHEVSTSAWGGTRQTRGVRALVAVVVLSLTLGACTRGSAGTEARPTGTPSTAGSAGTSPGCGSVPDDVTGATRDVTRRITVDSTLRQYIVHVPTGYDGSRPLPVVYLFHGLGSSAAEVATYASFPAAADDRDFILVSPQATGTPSTWDVLTPASTAGSDAAFWLELTKSLGDEWCVDDDRQYAAGMSNGSAVIFAMACSGEFPFKAYGGVAATFYDDAGCGDAPPASVVYFHGTGDEVVPFDGGETPLFPVRSVDAVMADWAKHDGCATKPRTTEVASDVELERWRDCDGSARLETYVIDDGGHTWPGADFEVPVLGNTTSSIDATELMVEFFGLAD